MAAERFADRTRLRARAVLLGDRIALREVEPANLLASGPLVLPMGEEGCGVVFRYGVVVLFGLEGAEQAFLQEIAPLVRDPVTGGESEEVTLALSPDGAQEGPLGGEVLLKDFSIRALQVVATVMAKSVVLAYYEGRIAGVFNRIEPLAAHLERTGRPGAKPRDLVRQLGEILLVQERMIGRVEVVEKPELVWEYPQYERLYGYLAEEYELKDRALALGEKLALITRTAETLLGFLQHRSSMRVEWYITLLIVVEILMTLYVMVK